MLVAQPCLTLCDLMDCIPPDSSVHGILQARILEWVAIPFSRASSDPGLMHCGQILCHLNHHYCCLVAKSCQTLCDPINCSTPGFRSSLSELAQTRVSVAIQPSYPLSPHSPLALRLSQHQGLCQWIGFSHQVAKVLELQHQS